MKNLPGLMRLLAVALGLASTAIVGGCTSNGVEAKPEIHGKMGVQVESQDTRHIRPVH